MLEGGLADVTAIDSAMRGIGFRTRSVRAGRRVGTDVNLAAERRHLRGLLRRSALPARRCSGAWPTPAGSAARRAAATTTTTPMARAARPGRRWSPDRAADRGWPARCRPDRGPHPGGDRERGRVGCRRWRGVARGDRYGNAARHELAGGSARLGRAHRPAVGRPLARRASCGGAGRPLPGHAAPPRARRQRRILLPARGTSACRSPAAIGPSSSTWMACCSIPRRSGTRPRRSSSRATAPSSRTRTRCA